MHKERQGIENHAGPLIVSPHIPWTLPRQKTVGLRAQDLELHSIGSTSPFLPPRTQNTLGRNRFNCIKRARGPKFGYLIDLIDNRRRGWLRHAVETPPEHMRAARHIAFRT